MTLTPTVPVSSVSADGATARGSTARFTAAVRRSGASFAATPDSVWVPTVSAGLILAAGATSLATGQPWLFPALGPTAVLVATNPGHPTTRFHSIVLGHLTGLACAWLALLLLVGDSPTLLSGHGMGVARVWASAFAVAGMALVQPSLRAYHPPAAATVLLVTLGVYRTDWKSALAMMAGVLVVAAVGEWTQRMRLREQDFSPASGREG
jgi:hypothetical protein